MTSRNSKPLQVAIVALQESSAAGIYSVHETLSGVGKLWQDLTGQENANRTFHVSIVSGAAKAFINDLGVTIKPDTSFSAETMYDIVIIPDLMIGYDAITVGRFSKTIEWLGKQQLGGATLCSICTGSILLAEAGLLEGLEATTHWSATQIFKDQYSNVKLHCERILVPAGTAHNIVTTGGSASWSELVLYLIGRFIGLEEAHRIAKIFLLGDRTDGQLPFASLIRPAQHGDAIINKCQQWIADNYAVKSPVKAMAQYSDLLERTFVRRFQKATGYTPIEYVQTLRVEEAKHMLEMTNDIIEDIAVAVGYEDPAAFRRLFKKTTGVTPLKYRQKFRSIIF